MTQRTLIVNPNASRITEQRIAEVEDRLRPAEVLRTEHRGHATELAREAAGDEVWVLGGDGVVNEALNGIRDGVALGVVPAGGANVLARALGARERRISVGRVNGRRFAFSAGSASTRRSCGSSRPGSGPRAAAAPAISSTGAPWQGDCSAASDSRLEVVGQGRAAAIFVSNDAVYTYAGPLPLRFLPDARFELGLDFAAPVRVTPLSSASLFTRVLAGRGMAGASGVLTGHDLDRIEVRCDVPLPLQADGEDLGDVTEAVFEVERDAVTVLL